VGWRVGYCGVLVCRKTVHYTNNTKPAVVVLLLFGAFVTVGHCHRFRSAPLWNRRGVAVQINQNGKLTYFTKKKKRKINLCTCRLYYIAGVPTADCR